MKYVMVEQMKKLVLTRVYVDVHHFAGFLYTGKLVKTILINAYPIMKKLFEPSRGSAPKPLHVSPIYRVKEDGRVECLYSYAICRDKGKPIIKCEGPPRPVILDGSYFFYFGFHSSLIDPFEFVNAIVDHSSCFEFINQKICVSIREVEIYDPTEISKDIVSNVSKHGGLKIVFSSPTILRDPLRTRGKFKTFLPTPENVFASPLYVALYVQGRLTHGKFRKELLRVRRLFNETYSVLSSVKIRWIYYSSRPEPALVGFVNYRLNNDYLEFLRQKINPNEWLNDMISYAITLGVGAGRATGFGHVFVKPLEATIAMGRDQKQEES